MSHQAITKFQESFFVLVFFECSKKVDLHHFITSSNIKQYKARFQESSHFVRYMNIKIPCLLTLSHQAITRFQGSSVLHV